MHASILCLSALFVPSLLAQAPQHLVVPAVYQSTDSISHLWIPGASRAVRQQTLVGASHLQGLVGRELLALELRRSAANETYQGGTANLTVTLSSSPRQPLTCDMEFAANIGANALQVFQGPVALPTSPPVVGPVVAWTIDNVVRIPFQIPFVYLGGTLCVDVVGQPIAGQNANWWMADAEFEDISGAEVQVGRGCGSFSGPQGQWPWSFVSTRTLVPGAYADFWAKGPPNSYGLIAHGVASPQPIPLLSLGVPSPGCDLHLVPNLVLSTEVQRFVPEVHPLLAGQATAQSLIRLPPSSWLYGLSLTTQWLELSQMATSNAIQWTVANAIPGLDMALVDGVPGEVTGLVTVHHAHVLRFEFR